MLRPSAATSKRTVRRDSAEARQFDPAKRARGVAVSYIGIPWHLVFLALAIAYTGPAEQIKKRGRRSVRAKVPMYVVYGAKRSG